ncbi:unnamed protein product [Dibothriocephalus latus]|uniref:Uncharacterized protein n=1 Tax=Dibothriocephalus latus TaxID=60516 RepID=A0A3P7KWX0_DIBLA|nr:unnamed protein product [Dibothriocephalus latus]
MESVLTLLEVFVATVQVATVCVNSISALHNSLGIWGSLITTKKQLEEKATFLLNGASNSFTLALVDDSLTVANDYIRSKGDIDECQEKEDICEPRHARGTAAFKCLNLHGDYRCISEHCPKMYRLEKLRNGFRCHLKPEHACRPYDHACLRDRPLLIQSYHIELVAPMKKEQLLAEIDSSIVVNGTVRAELRVHYAYQMRSNIHMNIEDAFKLRLKSPTSRFVDVIRLRPLEAPADLLISANLLSVRGRQRTLKSVTKLYIFTAETAAQQAAFERQQRRLLRGRGL